MLAKVESKFQPFPRGSCAPAAPPRAHRGPELPGEPPGHEAPQAGEGPHPEGSETSGYLQGGLSSQQPTWKLLADPASKETVWEPRVRAGAGAQA